MLGLARLTKSILYELQENGYALFGNVGIDMCRSGLTDDPFVKDSHCIPFSLFRPSFTGNKCRFGLS